MDKEQLKCLYSELRGYYSEAPVPGSPLDLFYNRPVWEHYNQVVDLVSEASGTDHSRFRIQPADLEEHGGRATVIAYRSKVAGLISRLHAQYFAGDPGPLAPSPTTVMTQTQQQDQSAYIAVLLAVQSKVDDKLAELQEGTKEHGFLQKFKRSLASVSNVVQLLAQCLRMAKESGLSIDELAGIFD